MPKLQFIEEFSQEAISQIDDRGRAVAEVSAYSNESACTLLLFLRARYRFVNPRIPKSNLAADQQLSLVSCKRNKSIHNQIMNDFSITALY